LDSWTERKAIATTAKAFPRLIQLETLTVEVSARTPARLFFRRGRLKSMHDGGGDMT
jgi:hypothetical protein